MLAWEHIYAQVKTRTFTENLKFSAFLQQKGFYEQRTWLYNQLLSRNNLSQQQKDTLYLLKAENFTETGNHLKAIAALDTVSKHAGLYHKAGLLQGYLYSINHKYQSAYYTFNQVKPEKKDSLKALKRYGLKASCLLRHKPELYDSLRTIHKTPADPVFYQEKKLKDYYKQYQAIPHHSKFLAGLLSAIIPGAGKAYTGNWKKGMGSFFPCALLGLQAFEGYYKKGFESPRFIIFGSLFSVFYAGNIWGSVLNVKIKSQERHEKIDRQILLDLHIPFHTLYSTK